MSDFEDTLSSDSHCLSQLQKYFLSVSDQNFLNWSEILEQFDVNYDSCQRKQEILLESTIKHPLVLEYPIKLCYQLHFLKKIISLLEGRGLEVSEDLYNSYLEVLEKSDNEDCSHYRHYKLPNNKFVSLRERKSFISDGTTGLCSWQGSFALSEWFIKNQEELNEKVILELGSGTGLAGLVLLSVGKPKCYYFSDCHPEVLKQLCSNVMLNIEKNKTINTEACEDSVNKYPLLEGDDEKDTVNGLVYWEKTWNSVDIKILNLLWESVEDYNLNNIRPDIIVASDVVYDESLFAPLCNTLELFLKRSNIYAILVCTVRNEATFKNFVLLLERRNFTVSEIPPVPFKHIPFVVDTPMKMLKIYFKDVLR